MVRNVLSTAVLTLFILVLQAQNVPIQPTDIVTGTYHGLSKPLRDIPPMTATEFHQMELKGLTRTLNKDLKNRIFPFEATALPKGADTFRQDFMGTTLTGRGPIMNFDGQTSPYFPPDCNGTAGPNHYMQTINTVYAIYDKSGNIVAGPTNLNLLFGSVPGANRNDGDPIILYDEQADRWVVTEFSIPFSGPNYILMAVSETNDPTGMWHQYSFQVASMPDYPKFSVWQDGYYMGDNNNGGNDIYVFEREPMLSGGTAQAVGFNNAWRPTSVDGFMCVPPIDNDGVFAPTGTPGLYIAFNDDALGGGADELWLYELTVDWTTPANSTFLRTQQLGVQAFNSNFGNNWNNIEQKGVSQRIDGIPQVIMNVPQYRNFGSYQTIVCCHTINMDGIRHAGIRWYELRKTTGDWEVRQQGTYAPDTHSRWMGSILLNGFNEIGLGYSVSSTEMNPSIFYCGQSAGEFASASGILDIAEDTIIFGENSQTGANRWGDYAQVSVDPTDDKTFWFTTQYVGSGNTRKTRIASFRYDFAPEATTLPATAVTSSTATLNGSVNPNGLPTDYHFEFGYSPGALTQSTSSISAGSGTITVDVSADLSGLVSDTNYFYRVVAVSSGGTTAGLRIKFTTQAAPFLSVTPENQNVPSWMGHTEFFLASNTSWDVSTDVSWCTLLSSASGTGSDTIRIEYAENPSVTMRSANITVTGLNAGTQVVTVTQEGAAPMLSVTPANHMVAPEAGNAQYEVISNTTWAVTGDAGWCTLTPSGTNNGVILASFEANTSVTQRVCSISVSAPGLPAEIVTLTQSGVAAVLSVSPGNRNVAYSPGTTSFAVTSNTDWTVTGNPAWCTVTQAGSGNGAIVVDYTQNTSDQQRIASLDVTAAGLPVQTVTVTQAKSSIGVGEAEAGGFAIFPNPTRGHFKVVPGTNFGDSFSMTVEDMTGKIIFKRDCSGEKEYEIDLSDATGGTYNVILTSNNKSLVKKLVIIK